MSRKNSPDREKRREEQRPQQPARRSEGAPGIETERIRPAGEVRSGPQEADHSRRKRQAEVPDRHEAERASGLRAGQEARGEAAQAEAPREHTGETGRTQEEAGSPRSARTRRSSSCSTPSRRATRSGRRSWRKKRTRIKSPDSRSSSNLRRRKPSRKSKP